MRILAFVVFSGLALLPRTAQAFHEGCVGSNELTSYMFRPNCEGVNRDPNNKVWPFKTNEMGLIAEPDYPPQPPARTLRVLVMGPSSLVNMTPTVGVIPSMVAELRRQKLSFGKYRKIEVINGAIAGFDAIQSYLLMGRLIERYNPHVVIYQSSLEAFSLQQANDHYSSPEFDSRGLAVRMGEQPPFWPVPVKYSSDLWVKLKGNGPKISVRLRGLRLAFYKLLIRIGLGPYRSTSPFSVYGDIHLRYLYGMRELAESRKARFYVMAPAGNVNVEGAFWAQLQFNAWYKPEWIAAKLLKWPHMTDQQFSNVTQVIFREFPTIPTPGVTLGEMDRYPGDYHPNEFGMEKTGKAWAASIGPRLAKDLKGLP